MAKKSPFEKTFKSYGKYYDIIYADKDYERECDFLEEIFLKYFKTKSKTILDIGCGTGGHSVPLAKRGYKVTGIDASQSMISLAKEKARTAGVKADFQIVRLPKLQLNRKFDACVCMFAVIDYLIQNKTIHDALSNIRRHLEEGSPFIFDFWYGPAVLAIRPSVRLKTIEKRGIKARRYAEPFLDTLHHTCRVNYDLIVTKGNLIVEEVKEGHVVRFFFPEEITHFLEESGFELLKLCPFLNLKKNPSEQTWNVTAISKAV